MFVIPSLVGGGAEKMLVDIINHLDVNRYEMSLVLFEKKGTHFLSIPSHVKIYDLNKKNRYSFLKLIFRLAGLFKKIEPDVTLSFLSYANIIAILSKFLSKLKFNLIITEHTHLSSALLYARCCRIKSFLYKALFNYANFIVVPSLGIRQHLIEAFNLGQKRIKTINNPIDLAKIHKLKDEDLDKNGLEKYILAAGRLTKQKGYPYLLKAYSLISKDVQEKLIILGEGEDEKKLKQMAKDLGVQEKVLFLGFQKNPYKFMKNASIFVLSSLWESFAIVLVESIACGTPVISTDCPSGPNEIITNGVNGILVPSADEKTLAKVMLSLLRDKELRKKLSEQGRKRAEDFRIEKILPRYEELF